MYYFELLICILQLLLLLLLLPLLLLLLLRLLLLLFLLLLLIHLKYSLERTVQLSHMEQYVLTFIFLLMGISVHHDRAE